MPLVFGCQCSSPHPAFPPPRWYAGGCCQFGGFLLFVLFSVSRQLPSMRQRNSTDPRLQMLGDSLLGQEQEQEQGQEQEALWLLLGLGGLWCCPQALQQVLVPSSLLVAVGLCPLAGHELGVPRCPMGSSAPFSSAFSIGSHLGADRAPAPAIQAAEPGPADDPVRRPPPCCRETPPHIFWLLRGDARPCHPSQPSREGCSIANKKKEVVKQWSGSNIAPAKLPLYPSPKNEFGEGGGEVAQ